MAGWKSLVGAGIIFSVVCNFGWHYFKARDILKDPNFISNKNELKLSGNDISKLENDMPPRPWKRGESIFYNGQLGKFERKKSLLEKQVSDANSLIEDHRKKGWVYGYLPQKIYKTLFP